jgi:hypothetical protein
MLAVAVAVWLLFVPVTRASLNTPAPEKFVLSSFTRPERYNFLFGSQDFIQLISASEVISMLQSEEEISRRRGDGDAVRAIGRINGAAENNPTRRV